jgi:hypothetical protein
MVTLLVDEGYAFDYLSILDVKKSIRPEIENNWYLCFSFLERQIGKSKMQEIINSLEYTDMIKANKMTFEAVNKAKENLISAKEVDDFNLLRYRKKIALQEKFFINKISEIKI